jgi:putative two-component system response regulator
LGHSHVEKHPLPVDLEQVTRSGDGSIRAAELDSHSSSVDRTVAGFKRMSNASVPNAQLPLTSLLDALGCASCLIDRSGTIVHINPPMSALAARSVADTIGRTIFDIYTSEDARSYLRGVLEHFDQPVEREFFLPRPDGTVVPVIYAAKPLSLDGKTNPYRVITMIDISSQTRAREDLKEQYELVASLSNTAFEQAISLKEYSENLELRVRDRVAELHEANLDAVYMLAVAAETKDLDTGQHVKRIERFSRALCIAIGMTPSQADRIGYSSILHDVGKIHVPDQILKKPGPLSPEERKIMESHTIIGERILSERPFFEPARRIARSHHENFDGTGYPDGMSGDAIPIEARIVHLVDVFDALVHERVYKKPWTRQQAIEALHDMSGRMFDPALVRAFDTLISDGMIDLIETSDVAE